MLPIENPADEARSAVRSSPPMTAAPERDDDDRITPDPFLEAVARIPTAPSAPPTAPELRPGDTLDRFVVRRELGRGGMGVVYAAEDQRLGREVALKVLPVGDDEERRRRFLREARAAAALSHPGIATIYDVGEDAGRVFIAMELVRGETLRARLAARPQGDRALPVAEAVSFATEIARALAQAHAHGVVHRDLKPENVMIEADPGGSIKLLDFGLAKRTAAGGAASSAGTASTEIGRILGTPGYMSPEQAKGRAIDARSDVFSFGVLLYEMLTGARPFGGATVVEVFIALDRDEPVPPSRKNRRVPAALTRVVQRCLRKDPAARYADAGEILADLAPLARPAHGASPKVLALAAAAVIAAGVASAMVARRALPARDSAPARAPAVATASAAAGPVPTAITELPVPAGRSAEALAAYRRGLGEVRSGEECCGNFERACKLDPDFAEAHVQLAAMALFHERELGREHFQQADARRAALGDRDRELLDAVEPILRRQPADWAESNRRLAALTARYPGDAQLWYFLSVGRANHDDFDAAVRALRRAIELDPDFLEARAVLGLWEAYRGSFGDGRAALDACLARSPGSIVCLDVLAKLRSAEGDCAGMEATARRMIAAGAPAYRGHAALARALAAQGRPPSTVREALRQALEGLAARADLPEALRKKKEAHAALRMAALAGDFTAAEREARALGALVATSRSQEDRGAQALALAEVLREVGRDQEAAAVAVDFLDRRDAWEPDPGAEDIALAQDATPTLLVIAARGGRLPRVDLERRREVWRSTWSAKVTPVSRSYLWLHGFARAADTAEDARAAMTALPRYEPLPPFRPETLAAADVGRAFLLAGRGAEAVAWLTHATRSCVALSFPIEHTRAHLWLAQAREAEGDRAAACAAYGVVLHRWGQAQPRSVSAQQARQRMTGLGCADAASHPRRRATTPPEGDDEEPNE